MDKVNGLLPVHLWTKETIQSVGEDIGLFEYSEITSLSARMRVQVNGLLPLIKESVIVYPSGEEVPVSLHYERLEKHCSKCYRLDHELKDCLEAKAQAKSLKASQEASSNSRHSSRVEELPEKELNSKEHFRFTASKPKDMNNCLYDQRKHHNYDNSRNYSETARRSEIYKEDPRYSRDSRNPRDQNRDWSRRVLPTRPGQRYGYEPYHSRTKPNHMVYREVTRARPAPKPLSISATGEERTLHQPEKRQDDEGSHRDIFGPGHSKQSPAARGVPLRAVTPEINQGALEEALEEVRDAMIMYTQCADPTESAARKERLRQAEAQGKFEETAALMVHASMATMPANNFFPKEPNNALSPRIPATQRLGPSPSSADPLSSPARIPAVQRLGPLNDEAAPSALLPPIAPIKRKPGRPPEKKTVQNSPKTTTGASSRKRKVQQVKPPLIRRKLNPSPTPQRQGQKLTRSQSGRAQGSKGSPGQSNQTPWILWQIWISRNTLVFNKRIISAEETLSKAIAAAREWQVNQKKETQTRCHQPPPAPTIPRGCYMLQTDAAWDERTKKAGLGWTLFSPERSYNSSEIADCTNSPLVAESLALRQALRYCRNLEIKEIRCQSDSTQLVKAIKEGNSNMEIYGTVADILFMVECFDFISFEWLSREKNSIADSLAKNILVVHPTCFTGVSSPVFLPVTELLLGSIVSLPPQTTSPLTTQLP
ncbi:hypothetical protein DY000_02055625 [Brassica cretica]|uniref:RNase H type-1 domain-containing protein n=1 Tax=Brassica cretica TaxID=69181 RepID=A0ABQ7AI09_BRACR|nr:hypothetical protein DY000_02055625 [Brassica cretica]